MPFQDAIGGALQRLNVSNLDNGTVLRPQFNPAEFTESFDVNYARQRVPGLSHQVLQYINTNNDKLRMKLVFIADNEAQAVENLKSKRILQSFGYPRRGGDAVIGGGPPRLIVIWPNVISLRCVLASASFNFNRFDRTGRPIQFTAEVQFEEIRSVRLLSDEVELNGSRRDSGEIEAEIGTATDLVFEE